MNSKFAKRVGLGAVAALAVGFGMGTTANARAPAAQGASTAAETAEALPYEQVKSFPVMTHLHSWQVLDDDSVIVWATPFQPYLVELAYPSRDLKFEQVIGVTSSGHRVYARFDSIKVAGFRYPIDSIYKMTREEARELARQL